MKKMKYERLRMEHKLLVDMAKVVRNNAYAPYSNYLVGAALRTKKGNIYVGCNVEDQSYTLTTHAEGNAIDTMVANGEREIEVLAIVSEDEEPSAPCGLCLQRISEFVPIKEDVILLDMNLEGMVKVTTLRQALPFAFKLK